MWSEICRRKAQYVFALAIVSFWFFWLDGVGELSGQTRGLIDEQAKKLEIFDFREKDLIEKLNDLEESIKSKREQIEKAKANLVSLERRSKGLALALDELNVERKSLEARLSLRLVYLYKYARRGYMRALCSAADLTDFRRRAIYLSRLMQEDSKNLENILSQQNEISKKLEEIKEEIKLTDALRKREAANLTALKEDVEKKVIKLMRIHEEKEFYLSAVRELESAGSKFKETIVHVEDRKDRTPLEVRDISGLKGKLPVPLSGTIVRGKKLFRSNRVHLEKGIFIRAKDGAQVRAVLPGRVEFSGRLKGYGQVVIINHGSRFFTISALLSHREKKEGDQVRQGDVIGEVGSAATGIGPSLYFEIRKGGKNLDPLKWLNTKG
ncbi:MAG: hypothetical protein DRH12_13065 [Deltaproteobacteria bacterium]|nr:MAG: hypothetical protein DRH12_13065 [Deltaproteobacteria bacterium]